MGYQSRLNDGGDHGFGLLGLSENWGLRAANTAKNCQQLGEDQERIRPSAVVLVLAFDSPRTPCAEAIRGIGKVCGCPLLMSTLNLFVIQSQAITGK